MMNCISFSNAVRLLRDNEVILSPTETFYGIISRVLSAKAAARVFCAKRRPADKPLPVIIGDIDQLDLIADVPEMALPLFDAFWPGPLSVLLPARSCVPPAVTAGTGQLAVRLSPHPAVRGLAVSLGEPITASSANISMRPAVTKASDLDHDLIRAVSGVLDLPPEPAGGLPSTLVRPLGGRFLRVLRQGPVTTDQLRKAGFDIAV